MRLRCRPLWFVRAIVLSGGRVNLSFSWYPSVIRTLVTLVTTAGTRRSCRGGSRGGTLSCACAILLQALLGFLERTGLRLPVVGSEPQSTQQTCESFNIVRLCEF